MCRKDGALYKNRRGKTAAVTGSFDCFGPPAEDGHTGRNHRAKNSTGRQAFQPAALFYKWGTEKEIYLPLRFLLTTHAPPVRDSSAMPAYRAMPASKVLGELMGLVVLGLVVGLEEATV